jgi:choline kinase
MKVGILAGGLGYRLVDDMNVRTKPMVKVDGDLVFPELICLFVRHFEA